METSKPSTAVYSEIGLRIVRAYSIARRVTSARVSFTIIFSPVSHQMRVSGVDST
jgi:hypothetical protein